MAAERLKGGDEGGELEPRAEGRAELSGSTALREQDRAEAKGRGHGEGAGQGMLRGCQGQNTLSAEGNN